MRIMLLLHTGRYKTVHYCSAAVVLVLLVLLFSNELSTKMLQVSIISMTWNMPVSMLSLKI